MRWGGITHGPVVAAAGTGMRRPETPSPPCSPALLPFPFFCSCLFFFFFCMALVCHTDTTLLFFFRFYHRTCVTPHMVCADGRHWRVLQGVR